VRLPGAAYLFSELISKFLDISLEFTAS